MQGRRSFKVFQHTTKGNKHWRHVDISTYLHSGSASGILPTNKVGFVSLLPASKETLAPSKSAPNWRKLLPIIPLKARDLNSYLPSHVSKLICFPFRKQIFRLVATAALAWQKGIQLEWDCFGWKLWTMDSDSFERCETIFVLKDCVANSIRTVRQAQIWDRSKNQFQRSGKWWSWLDTTTRAYMINF